jgi:hypothetical protein
MIILLTVIAIVVAGVPLAAVVLVTVASRREENAGSIGGRATGRTERAARRLLAFHATGIGRPTSRARGRGPRRRSGRPADDDRYRTARTDRTGPAGGPGRPGGPGRRDLIGASGPAPGRRP